MRCTITWHSLYYKHKIPKWAKGQCSSMSRWSEPWVGKFYILWCPLFHMFNHDSQSVHVDEWREPLSVNMMTEEMWQRWISSCQLAVRWWWWSTIVVYQHHRTEGIILPDMAHSTTSCRQTMCSVVHNIGPVLFMLMWKNINVLCCGFLLISSKH